MEPATCYKPSVQLWVAANDKAGQNDPKISRHHLSAPLRAITHLRNDINTILVIHPYTIGFKSKAEIQNLSDY